MNKINGQYSQYKGMFRLNVDFKLAVLYNHDSTQLVFFYYYKIGFAL